MDRFLRLRKVPGKEIDDESQEFKIRARLIGVSLVYGSCGVGDSFGAEPESVAMVCPDLLCQPRLDRGENRPDPTANQLATDGRQLRCAVLRCRRSVPRFK